MHDEITARKYCRKLMQKLESEGRIDFAVPLSQAKSELRTDLLFSEMRGQMFGVLVCERKEPDSLSANSRQVVLKAFSGQYNGRWLVEGWAPPLLDPAEFQEAVQRADPLIKKMTADIKAFPDEQDEDRLKLIEDRKKLSRFHMNEIHAMYTIRNFAGGETTLFDLFKGHGNSPQPRIPAGTGDCCAPKLLNQAVVLGLRPVSLAEFYWGRENRSAIKRHGEFYPPCREKCRPLLDFMLQGII